jgi:hypothetical protein
MRCSMNDFGNVLATREVSYQDAAGGDHTGYIDIGEPWEEPGDGEEYPVWGCRVQLRELGDDLVRTAYGEDAVQSLYLALVMAGVVFAANPLAPLTDWADLPNYGFPPPPAGGGGECVGCGGEAGEPTENPQR